MVGGRGLRRAAWAGLLMVALAGCGGGSSGSDGGASTSAKALNLAGLDPNAVTGVSFVYASVPLIWGQFVKDWTAQLLSQGGSSLTQDCPLGGQQTLNLLDKDNNRIVSAGDQIQVTLSACHEYMVDSAMSGTITLDLLTDPQVSSRLWRVTVPETFVLITDPDGSSLRAGGRFQVAWSQQADQESLSVTPSDDAPLTYAYTLASKETPRDVVSRYELTKVTDYAADRYLLALQLDVASALMGGSLTLRSTHPLAGYLNHTPDAGLVTLQGANGGAVTLGPDTALAAPGYVYSILRAAAAPGAGDAENQALWKDIASDLLWWAGQDLPSYLARPAISSSAVGAASVVPELSDLQPRSTAVGQSFHIQLSRAFQPDVALQAVLTPMASVDGDGSRTAWGATSVAADLTWNGARLTLTPSQALMHGWVYQIHVKTSYGMAVSQVFSADGQSVAVDGWRMQTLDTLHARIGAPGGTQLTAGASLDLDASGSTAPAGTVYRWRQVSGPTVVWADASAVHTAVSFPADSSQSGAAVVELELTAPSGQIERQQLSLQVLPSAANGGLMVMVRGNRKESFFDSTPVVNLYPNASATGVGSLLIDFKDSQRAQLARVTFSVPDVMTQGTYDLYATAGSASFSYLPWDTSNATSCWAQAGTVTVLEFLRHPDGSLASLALDVNLYCSPGQSETGSLRYHSTLPLP